MKKAITIVRIILGILVLIFGLNLFLQFMPMPQPSAEMGTFAGALAATGYMFPLIGIIQIVTGILLLINKAVPLALIVLFPVLINAFLAHLFLHDIRGIGAAAITCGMTIFLFFAYRNTYFELLKPQTL